jgi:hypothetical protein
MPSDRRRILRAINREARYIKDPHARRVFKKAAVETGIVESNLTNPSGGDADSAGWRQERRSLYANPTNISAATRRFRQEFQQHYQPGEKSYQVAAQVQRPRADLRGRYRDVQAQAGAILKGSPGVGPDAASGLPAATGPRYMTQTIPGVDRSAERSQAKLAYLSDSHNPDALLNLASSLKGSQDTPSRTRRVRLPGDPAPTGRSLGPQATGGALVGAVKAEADAIDKAHVGYQWGGGHAGKQPRGSKITPLDCSGAVSRVLGLNPRVSGQFEKWGKPGKGRITVYANQHHVLLEVDGHFWGTSATNPGGGPGWIPRRALPPSYLRQFTARHA